MRVFRHYSTLIFIVTLTLTGILGNLTEDQGGLGGVANAIGLTSEDMSEAPLSRAAQINTSEHLALVHLADTSRGVEAGESSPSSVIEESYLSPENQMFLAAALGSRGSREPEEDGGVRIYTVAEGDTVSGIATRFGITVNTILWANELANVDEIRPGDQIFILPVAGFAYVVQSGDTIESIATKYRSSRDKIIAFNELPANGELTVGEKITIPDGQKEVPRPTTPDSDTLARRQYASASGGAATDITPSFARPKEGKPGQGHRFPYGYCTWYVAQKRYVPWRGNAGTWLFNSRAFGYKTGKTPAVGSIVVTTEDRYYGHVAYVEKVNKDTITVSDMNYTGWGKKSVRQLAKNSKVIRGYIY